MRWFFLLFMICASSIRAENITVFGVGRMGLCLALCLEKAGYDVLGVDISEEYVDQLNCKTFNSPEPELNERLAQSKRFKATTSIEKGLEFADMILIAVPTNPSNLAGNYDCEILDSLLYSLNIRFVPNKHFIFISTLPPGYMAGVQHKLRFSDNSQFSYSPMFIAQGDIFKGIEYPEVVLIGQTNPFHVAQIEAIYKKINKNSPYIGRMSAASVEIAKLALNCFVTMKIAFANAIADIADAAPDADKTAILEAIKQDSRVGKKCISHGYGFGGPCFPRDNRALGDFAERLKVSASLFRATDEANQFHAKFMAKSMTKQMLEQYVFEDVCYKSNCPVPIIEESQKLQVAKLIAVSGKPVLIKDRAEVLRLVQAAYGDLFNYEEVK